MYFFVYSGEDDGDATLVRHLDEVLQVVHTGGIDEWYATHTDDADTRALAHTIHDVLEFACHSKEVRSVDFVNFHVFRNGDVFDIRIVDVGLCIRVDIIVVGKYVDLSGFCHTAHAEQTSKDESYFDGNGEVEDNSEDEG